MDKNKPISHKPYSLDPTLYSHSRHQVQNHIAGLDNHHFKQSLARLKQEYLRFNTPKNDNPQPTEDLPTWMQNRKLLVRVFIVWIMLVGYMLFSVFTHHNF